MYVARLGHADEAAEVQSIEMLVGRRSAQRLTVDLPASLQVGDFARDVLVQDASATGARLQLSTPPREGTAATLIWQDLVCRCSVVWSADEACGVRFEDQVALDPDREVRKPSVPPVDPRTAR